MKLKKIASLMLAGIMAVSMLAGCKGGTEKPENPEEVVDTSIARYFNEAQEDNDVKADFTYDTDIENMMKKAISMYGTDADIRDGEIEAYLKEKIDGIDYYVADIANLWANTAAQSKEVYGYLVVMDSTVNTDDATLAKEIAENFGFENLPENQKKGGFEYNYDHDGKVAMVKSTDSLGFVHTYIAVLVTVKTTVTAA